MRVLFISKYKTGGAGIAAYRIYQAVKLNPNFVVDWVDIDNFKVKPNLFRRLRNKFLKKKHVGDFEIFTQITGVLKKVKDKYDIIHLHWVADFLNYPTFFKHLGETRIVWTLHDMNPFMGGYHYQIDKDNNLNTKFDVEDNNFRLTKYKYLGAHKYFTIVSPSNWLKFISEKSLIFNNKAHYRIRNCVNTEIFKIFNKELCQSLFSVKNEIPTIMFIADNVNIKRKGLKLLIQALNLVEFSNEIQLLIIGGDVRDSFTNERLRIIQLGRIKDERLLALAYNAADVLVVPSLQDNLPNVLLEAMSCGLPVLSYNLGGMKDIIEPLINGLLVDELNEIGLSNSIQFFFDNKINFERNTIREIAINNFGMEVVGREYCRLYNSIVKK